MIELENLQYMQTKINSFGRNIHLSQFLEFSKESRQGSQASLHK